MSSGRPTVPLHAIYQQVPEFFSKHVDVADKTEVAIPFAKVLEQFATLQVRPDQIVEEVAVAGRDAVFASHARGQQTLRYAGDTCISA